MFILVIVLLLVIAATVWIVRRSGIDRGGWIIGVIAFTGAVVVVLALMVPEGGVST